MPKKTNEKEGRKKGERRRKKEERRKKKEEEMVDPPKLKQEENGGIIKVEKEEVEEGEGLRKSNDPLFSPTFSSPPHSPLIPSPPSSPSQHRRERKVQTLDFWKKRHVLLELSHSLGAPLDRHLRQMIIRLEPDKCFLFVFFLFFVFFFFFFFFFFFLLCFIFCFV